MPPAHRLLLALGLVLALAGLGRLALLVTHEPLLGYGDQADMQRVTGCLHIHPDVPPAERLIPIPSAPIPRYVSGEVDEEPCSYGSELAIAALAVAAYRAATGNSGFELRWIGYAKLLLAVILVSIACALLWRFPRAFLLNGATVFAILGDPLTGLWLNTFYAEAPILFGAYAMLAASAAMALSQRAGGASVGLLGAGILLLGLSKVQFFLLPLALVLLAMPVLLRADRRAAAAALVLALVPCAVFLAPGKKGVLSPNRVDTYLGALAPSSQRPLEALVHLGLPARCEPLVGATWFRRRGEDIAALCPEVQGLGMGAFVPLAIAEPRTIAVALAHALAPGQNVFTGYLGFVAGSRYGRFEQVPAWARSLWEPLFMQLRPRHYAALVALAACVGLLAALSYAILALRVRGPAFAIALYLSMLALCYAYTLATSVLGDGFADIGKHLVLAAASLAAGLVGGIGWWLSTWGREATRGARIATNAIVLAAATGAVTAMAAYRDLPLAMGVIDEPGDVRLEARDTEVRGWALDPYGVRAVEARVGAARFRAEDDLASPDLARVFPNYVQSARSGFRVMVPAAALTRGTPDLRVVVTNTRGIETEIDRRRLR